MAYMSQEGYDKLVADLQYLESVERPKHLLLLPKLPIRVT